jgi:hypothetical protein
LRGSFLEGVEILVIGGPEGRIFAEMGARVLGMDPLLVNAPVIDLPNLTEISEEFGPWSVDSYSGRFDLTMSCGLFDNGSGLVSRQAYNEMKQLEVYKDTLRALLDVTKKAGLGIHNGDAMTYAIDDNKAFCRLREVASPSFFKEDSAQSTWLIHVVQRN